MVISMATAMRRQWGRGGGWRWWQTWRPVSAAAPSPEGSPASDLEGEEEKEWCEEEQREGRGERSTCTSRSVTKHLKHWLCGERGERECRPWHWTTAPPMMWWVGSEIVAMATSLACLYRAICTHSSHHGKGERSNPKRKINAIHSSLWEGEGHIMW